VLTTHYLDEAERLCDRLAIMHEGRVVALDRPEALRADLGEQIVELRTRGDGGAALARLQEQGLAGGDAFSVGATVTIPLHDRTAAVAIAGGRNVAGAALIRIANTDARHVGCPRGMP